MIVILKFVNVGIPVLTGGIAAMQDSLVKQIFFFSLLFNKHKWLEEKKKTCRDITVMVDWTLA